MRRPGEDAPYDTIAVIGGGPSATYFLSALAEAIARRPGVRPARVVVVERGDDLGPGWVYGSETVLPFHNLAANESVTRVEKGRQLAARCLDAVFALDRAGVDVRLAHRREVVSVTRLRGGFRLRCRDGGVVEAGHVVLATGHWARRAPAGDAAPTLLDPWPATRLREAAAPHADVLLIGASHTAVDAALSLATARGGFAPDADGRIAFLPRAGARPLRIVMASRSGILPRVSGYGITVGRGDPDGARRYDRVLTESGLEAARRGGALRLEPIFRDLLREEPFAGVPRTIGFDPGAMDLAGAGGWIADMAGRMSRIGGERLLRFDLATARRSVRRARHIPWQALLWQKTDLWRAHLQDLPGEDRRWIDRYETVLQAFQRPLNLWNASRLSALADAGVLRVRRLVGPIAPADGRGVLARLADTTGIAELRFDVAVDCRGQPKSIEDTDDPLLRALQAEGLVQPSLVPFSPDAAGVPSHDPRAADERIVGGVRCYLPGGIHLDPRTMEALPRGRLDGHRRSGDAGGLFVLGPAMLGFYPISDGLHALHKVAGLVAGEILRRLEIGYGREIAALMAELRTHRAAPAQRPPPGSGDPR